MSLAELKVDPAAAARPWAALAGDEPDGWAHYGAWEGWLVAEVGRRDGAIPCVDPHWFDDLDAMAKINLYCLMCDMADGTIAPAGSEAPHA